MLGGFIITFIRKDNETEEELIYRICKQKDMIGTWQDVADILNDLLGYQYTESRYRKQWQGFNRLLASNIRSIQEDVKPYKSDDENDINAKIKQLQIERRKVQTEKVEYNRYLREEARDELILEKIRQAIAEEYVPAIDFSNRTLTLHNTEKVGILCFGDEHYGTEFCIKGLHNEIINAYSPEIFEQRMKKLLDKTIDIIEKEELTTISIYSMGDFIDGIIRTKQLLTLRYGVIESTIRYAKFIVNWLNTLTQYVTVNFQMTNGNHSQLRMLSYDKGTFEKENMGIVVKEFIKILMADNLRFNFIENPTGFIYENIYGYNFMGIHGEVKGMEKALKDFSISYNTQIDYLIAGHFHHSKTEEVGINKEVINVPSVIGIDEYGLSINKTSNPAATFLVVSREGIDCRYNINLSERKREEYL